MHTRSLAVASIALALVAAGTGANAPFRVAALGQQSPTEVELTVFNKGVHDRLGLPDFLLAGADAELSAAAKTVAEVLWDDLDFEREYYMIPRKESAAIPVAAAAALPYDRWAELGADAVVAAAASRSGQDLVIELRLMEVRAATRGRVVFGAKYTCRLQQARFCAHSIADDIHKKTKGLDGVARTKLAFTSDRDSARVDGRPSQTVAASKEIYIADYDGASQQRITVNRSINLSPSFSPTGTMLAYTSYVSGFPDIYIANLREPGRLLRPAGGSERIHNQMAAWSPDGSRLAFVSWRSGNADVWVVNRDGSGLLNLTNHRADDGAPTWSPDGGRIAFTSDRETGSSPLLYVMNSSSGAGVRNLTRVRADRPTWSPLNFIAFTGGESGNHDIALLDMNEAGSPVRILTDSAGTNEGPAVAPNGRHIAFFTTRWGRQQIAIIDRTGSRERIKQVTNAGNNTYPSWQPFAGTQK